MFTSHRLLGILRIRLNQTQLMLQFCNTPILNSVEQKVLNFFSLFLKLFSTGLQSVSSSQEDSQAKNTKQQPKVDYYSPNYQQQQQKNAPVYQIEPASLNTREYYSYQKAPATYPYNYGFIRRVKPEQPFWVKISEQVRDTFQNGFSQVQEIARPVMDPIMEAGEKISKNLGFPYARPQQNAQDKISTGVQYRPSEATSYMMPAMMPALGVLAGGAALGLGAVAMGRIFDVGSLLAFRSMEDSGSGSYENDRALEAINKAPTTTLFLVENNGNRVESNTQERSKYQKDTIELYASPTTSPKEKFVELIAIPYQSSSSIEPTSLHSQLTNHQRRKRNRK